MKESGVKIQILYNQKNELYSRIFLAKPPYNSNCSQTFNRTLVNTPEINQC